jgi:hypothetical protein
MNLWNAGQNDPAYLLEPSDTASRSGGSTWCGALTLRAALAGVGVALGYPQVPGARGSARASAHSGGTAARFRSMGVDIARED